MAFYINKCSYSWAFIVLAVSSHPPLPLFIFYLLYLCPSALSAHARSLCHFFLLWFSPFALIPPNPFLLLQGEILVSTPQILNQALSRGAAGVDQAKELTTSHIGAPLSGAVWTEAAQTELYKQVSPTRSWFYLLQLGELGELLYEVLSAELTSCWHTSSNLGLSAV